MKLNGDLFKPTLFLIILFMTIQSKAQSVHNIEDARLLHDEIIRMDSLLFNVAFNECDFGLWKSIMNEDLEFYDDRQGLNTSFDVEVRSFLDRCSKDFKVIRKLVSTEIYPLNNYGAVQLGVHEFYVDNKLEEIAKFVHIWRNIDENWVITRVVSFDHKPVE